MSEPTLVAAGIYQVTLPLPFALNHVHCYLLDDGDGWTVVDTGLHTAEGQLGWERTFDRLSLSPTAIKRIIVTHAHPDHYGMAGWLQAWGSTSGQSPPVLMSAREEQMAVQTWQLAPERISEMTDHLRRCGLDRTMAEEVAGSTRFVSERTQPHPQSIHHLKQGETLEMAGRTFEIRTAEGHSDGQLIFFSAADGLLLSADHVLMDITPNISSWPNTEPNPLGRYLDSLAACKGLAVRLALPGHKRLITDWNGRLAELEAHHAQRLEDTFSAVNEGNTVSDVALSVFRLKQLTVHEARFAITETLAHLDYLEYNGRLHREAGEVWRYYRH